MADSCLNKLKEKYGDKFSKSELKSIDSYIKDLTSNYNGRLSQYQELLKQEISEAQLSHLKFLKSEINGIVRLKKNMDYILQFKDPSEGLLSMWEGTTRPIQGSAKSVENLYSSYKADNTAQFNSLIKKDGLFPLLIEEGSQRAVWAEYLNRARDPKYQSNASPAITQAVDNIIKLNRHLISNEQRAGSTVTFNAERIVSNLHSPEKILTDVDAWIKDSINYIDVDRSFGPTIKTPEQLETALREFSETIGDVSKGDVPLGKIIGGRRDIYFKDGNSAYEYNKKYGHDNIYSGLVKSIDTSAKRAAAVEVFGDNPIKGYEKLKEFVLDSLGGSKTLQVGKADNALNYYRGVGNRFTDVNSWGAKAYKSRVMATTYNHMRVLGNVAWAVLEDLPMTLLSVRSADNSNIVLQSAQIATDFISSLDKVMRKDASEFVGVLLQDIERELLQEAGSTNTGVMARAADIYANWNLSRPLTRITRDTAIKAHQRVLVNNLKSASPSDYQKSARQVLGLSKKQMDDLVKVIGTDKNIDFQKVMNSDIGDEKYKKDILLAVSSYMNMMVERSVPKVGARQARILQRNLPKDDMWRNAVALVSDLKSSLLTISHSWAAASRYGDPTDTKPFSMNSARNLGSVALAVIVFNYAKEIVRETSEGKEPDPNKTEQEIQLARLTKSIAKSSIGGLVVDAAIQSISGQPTSLVPVSGLYKEAERMLETELVYGLDLEVSPETERKVMKRVFDNSNLESVPDFLERNSKLLPFQNHISIPLIQAIKGHIINEASRR